MKYLKNKKGFTLVELLVAITILGIIMAIALPQISNIRTNNKTTQYKKYAESMLSGAKLYVDSYTEDMFGNNTSGCVDISYEELKDKDLIKDLKVDGSTCKSTESFVRVRKANNHYFYEKAIYCKDKNGKMVYQESLPKNACNGLEPDEDGPHIEITPTSKNWTTGKNQTIKVKIWDEYGMLENTKVKFTWTKNGYLYGSPEIYDYKNKRYDGSSSADPISYDVLLPQGETGIFVLTVTPVDVRDSLGNYQTVSVTSGEYKLDNTPPPVPSGITLYKWTNNSTRPTSASGLTTIADNTWSNKNIFSVPNTVSDDHSGGVYYQYTTSGVTANNTDTTAGYRNIEAEGTSKIKWRACDQLDNCSDYTAEATIKIDKTKPTLSKPSNSHNDIWTNTNVTITGTASDSNGSGVAGIYYYYDTDETHRNDWDEGSTATSVTGTWSAERNNTVYFIAIDRAGNYSNAASAGVVKIDKTKPKITAIENPKDGVPTIPNLQVTLKSEEQGTIQSGIAKWKYHYPNEAWKDIANSASATFVDTFSQLRSNTLTTYSVCDYAGNCSDTDTTYVHLVDKCDGSYVTYTNGTTCSEECGDGTYNRLAWSGFVANTRCEAHDKTSGGSTCTLGPCETPVNDNRFYNCDAYYITTCSKGICNYTQKNGREEYGTLSEADAATSISSSCGQPGCSSHMNSVSGTKVYYVVYRCGVTGYGPQDGCTDAGRGSSNNDFYIEFSGMDTSKNYCAMWVNVDRPYSVSGSTIKYSGSWRTYYCGNGRYCSSQGYCEDGGGNCVES